MKNIFPKIMENRKRTSIKKGLDFEFSNSNKEIKNKDINSEKNTYAGNQKTFVNFTNSNRNLNQLDIEVNLKFYIILASKF